mgnify:CR=1 FL=1
MWIYEKRLQYPVNITKTDARIAKIIASQYGGPDGEIADYYVDHAVGIWPQSAGGIPFNSCEFQSKGDPITDMFESMAAEQKARSTYDNILRVVRDIPEIADPIRFLRAREVVHFQRFGEALQSLQDQLNSKNFYQMNPSFDIGLTREPCDCQGECVQ